MRSESRPPSDPAASFVFPSETIQWRGQPDPEVRLAPADRQLAPLLNGLGMLIFLWEVVAIGTVLLTQGGGFFLPLFSLPFVALAAYGMWGRFCYKRLRKERTHYILTDRRLLVIEFAPPRQLRVIPLEKLGPISRRLGEGGSGSIVLGTMTKWQELLENTGLDPLLPRGLRTAVVLHDLVESEHVYELLLRQRIAPADPT